MPGYPPAPRADIEDDYFGTKVADPFRPLEDIDAPATRAWLEAQRAITQTYFAQLGERNHIRADLAALADYERSGIPDHARGTYIVAKNTGLQNQAVLYTMSAEFGEPRVLLDPNALCADGTIALSGGSLSPDGTLFAYALQRSGSDWQTWHVRDVASGADLADSLVWAKFSDASWAADGSGFYYSAYDPPADPDKLDIVATYQKIYFHRVGTDQAHDVLVYERADDAHMYLSAVASDDGAYLVIYESRGGVKNGLIVRDLREPGGAADVRISAVDVAAYAVLDNDGPMFYVHTTQDAPNGRIVTIDLRRPNEQLDLVATCDDVLQAASRVGGRIFASYLRDAHSVVRIFASDGSPCGEVPLPGIGSARGFGGRSSDAITYFAFTSFTAAETIYRYEIATGATTVYAQAHVAFDADAYVTEQRFAVSRDGTRVPVFVMRARGAPYDGTSRTILYGYGGFDISLTPAFSATVAGWLASGGTYAVANLRGGGEYGQAWHEAGMRERKQNVFDDFVAVADYLVEQRITSRARLALCGGSNGGLLCAAVITQRPQLAAAVLCDVGVMDMLRFHRFTVGAGWIPEYGCADATENEFRTLHAYSPLANVRAGTNYPAILVSTGDHDDRVFPAHSFKFVAALQEAQGGDAPILLFIESRAGHGAGKPLAKLLDEGANRFAFLRHVLA